MTKSGLVLGTVACLALVRPIDAQVQPIRSTEYLFLTNVSDARATWVNPAGLASIPEASVMAEFTVGRSPTDRFMLDQFSLGFNSRGMSVAYLRNRFEGQPATTILRLATGIPISGGALGFGASLYGAPGENDRGYDLGLLYGVRRILTVGAAARNIGRPTVNNVTVPIALNGGALVSIWGGAFQIAGEAIGVERLGSASGWDVSYRGGTTVRLPLARPLDIIASADLGSNFRIDQLHLGVAVGGRSNVTGIVSGVSRNGSAQIERLSVAGVASNLMLGPRR